MHDEDCDAHEATSQIADHKCEAREQNPHFRATFAHHAALPARAAYASRRDAPRTSPARRHVARRGLCRERRGHGRRGLRRCATGATRGASAARVHDTRMRARTKAVPDLRARVHERARAHVTGCEGSGRHVRSALRRVAGSALRAWHLERRDVLCGGLRQLRWARVQPAAGGRRCLLRPSHPECCNVVPAPGGALPLVRRVRGGRGFVRAALRTGSR